MSVDRYKPKKKIGEGGMQTVHLAVDEIFDRDVALKVPKNDSAQKRFQVSAKLSAQVSHPNIAKTLDYYEVSGVGRLVEEYVPGIDLGKWLAQFANFIDPHLAAHLLHHVVKGLAAVHRVGVIHRDLKPGNILVSNDLRLSTIKVTDFGIAKMAQAALDVDIESEDTLTSSSTVVGALPYMSPELLTKEESEVGVATDIWSTGAILYRLLAGTPPYGGGPKAVQGILNGNPPDEPKYLLTKRNYQPLGRMLWDLILECMRSEANERPTAGELVERCAELCYIDEEREAGTVYNYKIRPGAWGFITSSSGEDIFLHEKNFFGRPPKNGMKVAFSAFSGNPNVRAFPAIELENSS